MTNFVFGETTICAGTSADSGQPTVYVQDTPRGTHLVQALTGALPVPAAGFYGLPHDAALDTLICDLIETLIALRYAHPDLLQLRLFPEVAE